MTRRFFIEHGMIHDRVTGRHVTTDEPQPAVAHLPDINETLALLNSLDSQKGKPLAEQGCFHCNAIKRNKILGDPREYVSGKATDIEDLTS